MATPHGAAALKIGRKRSKPSLRRDDQLPEGAARSALKVRRKHSLLTVLFGMTGSNPLRDDAQLHPVERQGRKSRNGSGSKGWPLSVRMARGRPYAGTSPQRWLAPVRMLTLLHDWLRSSSGWPYRSWSKDQCTDDLGSKPAESGTKLIRFSRLTKWLRCTVGSRNSCRGHRQTLAL